MKARAAVVLIQNDRIALVERHRSGRHYFVFPSGKFEQDETPAGTAACEAREELGLEVKNGLMDAEIWYQGTPQYYFLAHPVGGQLGHGADKELKSSPDSEKGAHLPIWMPVDGLLGQQVLPKLMVDFVWRSYHGSCPTQPLRVTDRLPDEMT